ncbi:MAG: FAD-dependent oxidoreductase [Synergistota bacterium]|nr:FAD-dependent oxidoreductase [Synergistota bacterium]
MEKIVILGGGPAGITASKMLRKNKPDWDVTMVRPEPSSLIYCAIPYVVEGLLEADGVCKSDDIVTETGTKLIKDSATEVDFDKKTVKVSSGDELPYDKLLIALGARPVMPPLEGMAGAKNTFPVKTEEDLRAILKAITPGSRKALVIGAGNIGIEMAQALKKRGLDTYMVEMAKHVLPAMMDGDMVSEVEAGLRDKGIDLITGVGVDSLERRGEVVSKAVLSDGREIVLNDEGEDDLIIVSVGVRPEVDILKGTEIPIGPMGILVNERMETGVPDVWAAGDVCQYRSFLDEEIIGGKLATNAVPMAKVAARNMMGTDWTYDGFVNGAATVVDPLRIGGVGFSEETCVKKGMKVVTGKGKTTTRFPMMPGATEVTVKLIFTEEGKLVGGQVVGGEAVAERIDTLTMAIKAGFSVKDLMSFDYCSQPWQTFFPASNAIVAAAEDGWSKLKE